MPANVKFVAEADVSAVLRADKQVQESQKLSEKGFGRLGDAGVKASERTAEALKKEAKAYELVEQAERRAFTTRGTQSRAPRGPAATPYGLAPQAVRASGISPGVAAFAGANTYRLGRTDDESFQRFLQAGQIRQGRSAARQNASDDVAFSDFLDTEHKRRRWGREALVNRLRGRKERAEDLRSQVGDLGGAAAATVGAGIYGAAEAAGRYADDYRNIGAGTAQFEGDVRGLLGLGDNLRTPGRVRSDVLAKSAAAGVDRTEVAGALFSIQSGMGDASSRSRAGVYDQAKQIAELKGGSLSGNAEMLMKAMSAYGDAFGGSVKQLANWAANLEERAVVDFQDLGTLMPDLLPVGKLAGLTPGEMGGGLEILTKNAGKNANTFTGFRNTLLRMPKAEEELGIKLDGSFEQRIGKISQAMGRLDADSRQHAMKKIFGEETIVYASILIDKVKDLNRAIRENAPSGKDILGAKRQLKLSDPQARDAGTLGQLDTLLANKDAAAGEDPDARDRAIRLKAAEIGYEKVSRENPMLRAITPEFAKNLNIARVASLSRDAAQEGKTPFYVNQNWMQRGMFELESALLASGDREGAQALKLQFGSEFDNYVTDASGGKVYSGREQADRLSQLRTQVPGLRFSDFMGMWGSEVRGDQKGASRAFAQGRLNAAKDGYSTLYGDATADNVISPDEQAALDRQSGVVRSMTNLDKQPALTAASGGQGGGGGSGGSAAATMSTAANTMLEAAKLMKQRAGTRGNDQN